MARRFRDRVRVSPDAHGERTGSAIAGRIGIVCDSLADELKGPRERYWVRFDHYDFEIFYDWVFVSDLRDY